MTRSAVRLWAAVAAMLACAAPAGAGNGPSPETMAQASAAVVQIIARGCPDESRTGSGFLWEAPTQIVTALHVVAGCQQLFAYFTGSGEAPATLRRTLLPADLALLEVASPPSAHPLKASPHSPQVNETLQVIGYYFGVPTLDSRPLHVTLGSAVLGDMVPDKVRTLLQAAGSPSLSAEILRLDGNLLPGLSGAPIIDEGGGVVGIGSGGLENGTAGVSWAIQAHYLSDLRTAALELPTAVPASQSPLFSAPAEGAQALGVRCGDFVFVRSKTRTLQELSMTADDLGGLLQIAALTGLPEDQLAAIEYDVYTEQEAGGSVALPSGATLSSENGACKSRPAEGLEITLGSARVGDSSQAQQASVAFEARFDLQGFMWQLDPNFTYMTPMARADGLVVRRKNAVGFAATVGGPAVAADAFETLMTRGTSFVGIRVLNARYNPPLYQQCSFQPQIPECGDVNRLFGLWVAAALGIQLSTFPIN
jgi:S1-C subfamily serine protease